MSVHDYVKLVTEEVSENLRLSAHWSVMLRAIIICQSSAVSSQCQPQIPALRSQAKKIIAWDIHNCNLCSKNAILCFLITVQHFFTWQPFWCNQDISLQIYEPLKWQLNGKQLLEYFGKKLFTLL